MISILASAAASAQNDKKIEAQRKVIADLERKVAAEEKNISKLKNDRSSAQERVNRLSRQIEARNDLLQANEQQSRLLQNDVDRANFKADSLARLLEHQRRNYAEMVRESYRNYRNDNYISFIFSSDGFLDMARRIALLREVAAKRTSQIENIRVTAGKVELHRAELARQKASLDSVKRKINNEKAKMQQDVKNAKSAVQQLSSREKQAIKQKAEKERQLSLARNELQKLIKGNKVGNSFSKASKIDLPVEGGSRGKIVNGVCEINGKPNAAVKSVYDGKVVAVKPAGNRYEVYIAHGERVSSYSNLSAVTVKVNQTVKRNERIGTIGSWVNPLKSEPEYKILFQLQSPNSNESFNLAAMFGK